MSKELSIEYAAWVIAAACLFWLVPRSKAREAHVIFLFKQLQTFLFGLLVVEYGLIEYPVRLMANATRASFTFEYFVYPAICVFFNLFYPEDRPFFRKALHYFYYCTGITVFEVILLQYTRLIVYVRWTWYWTWLTLFLTFAVSRLYYRWFFRVGQSKAS